MSNIKEIDFMETELELTDSNVRRARLIIRMQYRMLKSEYKTMLITLQEVDSLLATDDRDC